MATVEKNVMNTETVVYDAEQEAVKKQPEFNSDVATPYCQLGDEVLNANINWLQTVSQILATGAYTLTTLSREIGITKSVLLAILENDVSLLNFRTGAKLITIHDFYYFTQMN